MNSRWIFIILTFLPVVAFSQEYVMKLWEDIPPNYHSTNEEKWDSTDIVLVRNVDIPEMAVYLPSKRNANGKAVVICPGGGYYVLAYDWEGTDIAKWFNSRGVAAIVLKYRVPAGSNHPDSHKSPLIDARRALKLARHNAGDWNIHPDKVGIMGFSAGGHLASTLATHFDYGDKDATDSVERQSSRPDFMVLVYPGISFDSEFFASGSSSGLLGKDPDPELLSYYSNELHVAEDTPPAFIVHAQNDEGVSVYHSLLFYQALIEHGVRTEMHLYPTGGHGFSFGYGLGTVESWTESLMKWLNQEDFKK